MKSKNIKDNLKKEVTLEKKCKNCELVVSKKAEKSIYEQKIHLAYVENLRKQHFQETENLMKFCHQDLASALLPVVDSLGAALKFKNLSVETKKFLVGVQIAYDNIYKTLKSFDVKEIKVKIGQDYNANFHQTIGSDWDEKYPENTILNIKQPGFLLHDRVIRAVQVIINQPKELDQKKNN